MWYATRGCAACSRTRASGRSCPWGAAAATPGDRLPHWQGACPLLPIGLGLLALSCGGGGGGGGGGCGPLLVLAVVYALSGGLAPGGGAAPAAAAPASPGAPPHATEPEQVSTHTADGGTPLYASATHAAPESSRADSSFEFVDIPVQRSPSPPSPLTTTTEKTALPPSAADSAQNAAVATLTTWASAAPPRS